jgi:hypothetical protein
MEQVSSLATQSTAATRDYAYLEKGVLEVQRVEGFIRRHLHRAAAVSALSCRVDFDYSACGERSPLGFRWTGAAALSILRRWQRAELEHVTNLDWKHASSCPVASTAK